MDDLHHQQTTLLVNHTGWASYTINRLPFQSLTMDGLVTPSIDYRSSHSQWMDQLHHQQTTVLVTHTGWTSYTINRLPFQSVTLDGLVTPSITTVLVTHNGWTSYTINRLQFQSLTLDGLVTPSIDYRSSHSQINGLPYQSRHQQTTVQVSHNNRTTVLVIHKQADSRTSHYITRLTPPPHESPGRLASGRQGSPNPEASEYPNVSALHNSHSHAPRDAKDVVTARYGASQHKITVPSLKTEKTLPLYTLCSETIVKVPLSASKPRCTIPYPTPRFRGPLRAQTNGKFNCFPKFPITLVQLLPSLQCSQSSFSLHCSVPSIASLLTAVFLVQLLPSLQCSQSSFSPHCSVPSLASLLTAVFLVQLLSSLQCSQSSFSPHYSG